MFNQDPLPHMLTSEELRGAVAEARAANPTVGSKSLVERFRRERGWAEVDNKAVKAAIEALQRQASDAAGEAAQGTNGSSAPSTEETAAPGAWHECSYCGTVCETKRCQRCVEMNVAAPARYCSEACQEAHWPAHVKWHRKLKELNKMTEASNESEGSIRMMHEIEEDAKTGGEVAKLIAKGSRFCEQQNYSKAVKAYNAALALAPTDAGVHHNLAVTLSRSNEKAAAAKHAVLAVRWHELKAGTGSDEWARTWAVACSLLLKEECSGMPRPSWWSDEELLRVTKRVVQTIPDEKDVDVWQTRAKVLAGRLLFVGDGDDVWRPQPRSCKQLKEAAACFTRQAQLIPYLEESQLKLADFLNKRVAMMQMLGLDVELEFAGLGLGK